MDESNNVRGADNQQERLCNHGWVVGFVDGEGCFSCPLHRSPKTRLGWQVQPRFVVVQGQSSRHVLEDLVRFFGCGRVGTNQRHDNHREDLSHYYVHRLSDLREIIIPFFEEHPLRTSKRDNFGKFAKVVCLMGLQRHLTVEGMAEIAAITETMNRRKPSEFLRILRDHTPTISASPAEMKRWSEPCGDAGRPAETTGPLARN